MLCLGLCATVAIADNVEAPKNGNKGEIVQTTATEEKRPREPITASQNDLKEYLADVSKQYWQNYELLYKVIECESSFRYNAIGDGGLAFGIAQFHKPTFKGYCSGDYRNPYDQIDCFVRMVSEGNGYHWTCYRKFTEI